MLMEFGGSDREKERRLAALPDLRESCPDLELYALCAEGTTLDRLAESRGLPCMRMGLGGISKALGKLRLAWKLRAGEEPWILHAFDPEALGLALRLADRKTPLQVVYSAPRPEFVQLSPKENPALLKAVIVPSKYAAERFADLGLAGNRPRVIRDFLEQGVCRPCRRKDKRIIFVCSDSLEPGKGYEQLLRALPLLYQVKRMPAWELRIAGGGSLFEPIIELAKDLGVDGRLAIFGANHGADILQDGDMLIVPAETGEDSSLAIMEGWASGLPVLCSDSPPHLEIVQDGVNALCFKDSDHIHLAGKIGALARGKKLRQGLAKAGQKSLASHTREGFLQAHLEVYRSLSDACRPR
ncbi:MAG: glycosyltransferase family 4 protein [Desulfovibrionaceae bacterium]|nr:glycosyltransferase family 4 protein [Desulfovibrionaceae bacterium]